MIVAGVEVGGAPVAHLALLLLTAGHRDLAQHVGTAIDTNQRELTLSHEERAIVLNVLSDTHDRLAELRDAVAKDQPRRRFRFPRRRL